MSNTDGDFPEQLRRDSPTESPSLRSVPVHPSRDQPLDQDRPANWDPRQDEVTVVVPAKGGSGRFPPQYTAVAPALRDDEADFNSHFLRRQSFGERESQEGLLSGDEMSRQKHQADRKRADRPGSTASSPRIHNGHLPAGGNSHLELRRKELSSDSLDSPTLGVQTERLIGRESFSLDDEPPPTPGQRSHGFWELPMQERRNFVLLVLLYFLQGIPMGLAGGSVPFLLKSHLSYSQIGIFSLAAYPYSLKLLWSPIVDALWSRRIGRRRSWILPIQMLSGMGMIWLGGRAEKMMEEAGAEGGQGVWSFTGWWFFLVFMCATQDIAVDGEMKQNGRCVVIRPKKRGKRTF